MKIDESGMAGRLGETVRHPEHDAFLQPKDILEIRRKVLQKRQFVRTRIPKNRRQAVLTKKIVGGRVNRFHHAILSVKGMRSRARRHTAPSWYTRSSSHGSRSVITPDLGLSDRR